MLCDFHIHSDFSDGQMSIPEIVDLYGSHRFGAIAITDHLCETRTFLGAAAYQLDRSLTPANFPLYREILKSEAERAWRQYQMVVLPGFEITKNFIRNHRSAHILAVGISEYVSADGPVEKICDTIHGLGGLAIAAHPVNTRKREKQTYLLWDNREKLKNYFDAWEVASGRFFFEEVRASGLPLIANSDLHRPEQINSWKTVLNCEKDENKIKNAIRTQKVQFEFFRIEQ